MVIRKRATTSCYVNVSSSIYVSILLVTLAFSALVSATTINVTSLADVLSDDGQCTLREAVISANENFPSGNLSGECPAGSSGADTISLVSPGIYSFSLFGSDEDEARTGDLDITESVTIQGGGVENYVINANRLDRVFHIIGDATNVSIRTLTITGGQYDYGAGVYIEWDATLLVEDALISANRSDDDGAGVYSRASNLTVRRTELRNNRTSNNNNSYGGGIYIDRRSAIIDSCKFIGNFAGGRGGGIYDWGDVSVKDTLFSQNVAQSSGGAVHVHYSYSSAVITNSTFLENSADDGGGAWLGADTQLYNSTFNANQADANGGGLYLRSGDVTLEHVTLDEGYNIPSSAIYIGDYPVVTVSNTIVAGRCNAGTLVSFGGNIETPGNTCGLNDPADLGGAPTTSVNLQSLKNNGGRTPTQLPGPDSIALENGVFGQCLLDDQRNIVRPQDFDSLGGGQCDIGAVELIPCVLDDVLILSNDVIATEQTFEACTKIEAGTDFILDYPALVTMEAGELVVFKPGFGISKGASLQVEIDWAFWEDIP